MLSSLCPRSSMEPFPTKSCTSASTKFGSNTTNMRFASGHSSSSRWQSSLSRNVGRTWTLSSRRVKTLSHPNYQGCQPLLGVANGPSESEFVCFDVSLLFFAGLADLFQLRGACWAVAPFSIFGHSRFLVLGPPPVLSSLSSPLLPLRALSGP